jgi:hypothetical protein
MTDEPKDEPEENPSPSGEKKPITLGRMIRGLGGSILVGGFLALVICYTIQTGQTEPVPDYYWHDWRTTLLGRWPMVCLIIWGALSLFFFVG